MCICFLRIRNKSSVLQIGKMRGDHLKTKITEHGEQLQQEHVDDI